jgi:hypothetical protein
VGAAVSAFATNDRRSHSAATVAATSTGTRFEALWVNALGNWLVADAQKQIDAGRWRWRGDGDGTARIDDRQGLVVEA